MKKLIILLTFMKIGLISFGGGYGIFAVAENELINKKRWVDQDEFLDIVAIAESTPGPLAINLSTYIGYKVGGIAGAVMGTAGVSIPSLIIIYIISFVYEAFKSNIYIAAAFRGIQVCVVYLIVRAGIGLLKKMKKDRLSIAILIGAIMLFIGFSFFEISVSSVFFILIAGAIGIIAFALRNLIGGKEGS